MARRTDSPSKAEQERIARAYQDDGAPVVIVHPGGVWGPVDPYLGESQQFVQTIVSGMWTLVPGGLLPISDVRDVARVLAAVLEPGKGPPPVLRHRACHPMTSRSGMTSRLRRRLVPLLIPTACAK